MSASERGASGAAFGRSAARWEAGALVVDVDERSAPFGRPVRGRVVFHPESAPVAAWDLDDAGVHRWWPVAPRGVVEVALAEPAVRFSGLGYHDANAGSAPLEAHFSRWSWARGHAADGGTVLAYDVALAGGGRRSRRVVAAADGSVAAIEQTISQRIRGTAWGLEREAPVDASASAAPRVARALEDTPFYARALVETTLGGRAVTAMHEELSLERLQRRWVQALLGFRMGRRSWAR